MLPFDPAVAVMICDVNVNALLTAEVIPPPLNAVRFFEPERLMLKSLNVARPEALVTCVTVPDKLPVPVVSPMLTKIPARETLFPEASCNCTVTGGEIATPATPLDGCCANASFDPVPAVTVNVPELVGVNTPEVARISVVPVTCPVKTALLLSTLGTRSPETTPPVVFCKSQLVAAMLETKLFEASLLIA